MNAAAKAVPERKLALMPALMSNVEFQRTVYYVTQPEGHTLEDALQPTYWSHVAARLKPCDRIEITHDNMSYWADLLVVSADRYAAVVQVINKVDIDANSAQRQQDVAPTHQVMFKGPRLKWSIIRLSDSQIVKDGFPTRERASEEMRSLQKALER